MQIHDIFTFSHVHILSLRSQIASLKREQEKLQKMLNEKSNTIDKQKQKIKELEEEIRKITYQELMNTAKVCCSEDSSCLETILADPLKCISHCNLPVLLKRPPVV